MATVIDVPPQEIQQEIKALQDELDRTIPARVIDQSVLVATWNLRAFGDLTEKWESEEDDSPKRDLHSIRLIAEIIRRFDVVALQEVRGNLKALRHTMKVLGPNWSLILTDVTRGKAGNNERLGFLFDQRTVKISGLAGELVVPEEEMIRGNEDEDAVPTETLIRPDALQRQFARTPYAVSFRCGNQTFILVTLHVLYGDVPSERIPELRAIAKWLDEWARDVHTWDEKFSLITLGDFNIDRKGNEQYEAFVSTGLHVPDSLQQLPRTIFSKGNPTQEKFYDQIAWFTEENGQDAISLEYRDGGYFDFTSHALQKRNLSKSSLSWHISDHYPLWVEFGLPR
ncbi:endonuclease/exonuclease/phosphatase family protein [Haladaptatus sp. DFWS20]|uniref:endonuclease/exonuclease/phosphatase family protein n=1 Tax=Haladaptatus sp. DFWS20 TaxID=3403467 RepID=UPI003EBC5FCA